jgi:hypothetical protein
MVFVAFAETKATRASARGQQKYKTELARKITHRLNRSWVIQGYAERRSPPEAIETTKKKPPYS